MTQITQLLAEWTTDPEKERQLVPMVYDDLRRIARRQMAREQPDAVGSPTELVHEAFLRLRQQNRTEWQSRGHFLRVAYRIMHRLLIDAARRRVPDKRLDVDADGLARNDAVDPERQLDAVTVRRGVRALARRHPEQAEVVRLRFLDGLTREETATHMNVSVSTVTRHWRTARIWLRHWLAQPSR